MHGDTRTQLRACTGKAVAEFQLKSSPGEGGSRKKQEFGVWLKQMRFNSNCLCFILYLFQKKPLCLLCHPSITQVLNHSVLLKFFLKLPFLKEIPLPTLSPFNPWGFVGFSGEVLLKLPFPKETLLPSQSPFNPQGFWLQWGGPFKITFKITFYERNLFAFSVTHKSLRFCWPQCGGSSKITSYKRNPFAFSVPFKSLRFCWFHWGGPFKITSSKRNPFAFSVTLKSLRFCLLQWGGPFKIPFKITFSERNPFAFSVTLKSVKFCWLHWGGPFKIPH